jgi:hypothetical protein
MRGKNERFQVQGSRFKVCRATWKFELGTLNLEQDVIHYPIPMIELG